MSEEKLRFNVGDVVVNLKEVYLWDNIYHFENFISSLKKEVVKQADRFRFTTLDNVNINSYEDREKHRNTYHIYDQNHGVSINDSKQVSNWTTNEKNIRLFFQKKFNEALSKCDLEDKTQIEKLEAEIRAKQAQIEKIRAGNRSVSYDSKINEREFINGRINQINNILDSF